MFPMTLTINSMTDLQKVMAALHPTVPAEDKPVALTAAQAAEKMIPKAETQKEPTPEPENKTASKPAAADAPAVDYEQLKKEFLALANKDRDAAVGVLSAHGVAKLPEVKPEQYVSVKAAIEKAMA